MSQQFTTFESLKLALLTRGQDEIPLVVMLTPELAQDILNHDPVNRKIRTGNLLKLEREIRGQHWDLNKCTPIRFLPSGRMADGQHRCRAVIATGIAVLVYMVVVPDTVGVDEGANRTLVDHLQLGAGLDEPIANLVSPVIKALCHVPSAGNRDYLTFYQEHKEFILECAQKAHEWIADQQPSVAAVFKPPMLAVLRARAIREAHEPAVSVDELLYDAINAGATAPDGSPRQALARQFWQAMQDAFKTRKAKPRDILRWFLTAIRFARDHQVKNILTARLPGDKRRRAVKRAA
jgi:hypothetical protein